MVGGRASGADVIATLDKLPREMGGREAANQPEGPIVPAQRIVVLDVLRGFALLGILVLNIESFSGPSSMHDVPIGTAKPAFVGWHASLDLAILSIKWLFFEGKMRTLFSMLYGAGIVLLTERFERRGQEARLADIYCRRNMWLLLFGLIHGTLIWQGDILSQYAAIALLVMYPLRKLAARRLILLGMSIGILGGTYGVARMMDAQAIFATEGLRVDGRKALAAHRVPSTEQSAALAAEAKATLEEKADIAQQVESGRAPYLESIAPRTDGYLGFVIGLFRSGWILEVTGSMLMGMGLYKAGFLTGKLRRRTYMTVALIGYAISIPIVLTGVAMSDAGGFSPAAITRWLYLPYVVEAFSGSIANAALLLFIIKSEWLKVPTTALANVGRTAFSNYILTSVLCQTVFAWGPWKLYGALEYYEQSYVILAVWGVNLIASAIWLRAFIYGPLEWIWRSLVYWQVQPLRR